MSIAPINHFPKTPTDQIIKPSSKSRGIIRSIFSTLTIKKIAVIALLIIGTAGHAASAFTLQSKGSTGVVMGYNPIKFDLHNASVIPFSGSHDIFTSPSAIFPRFTPSYSIEADLSYPDSEESLAMELFKELPVMNSQLIRHETDSQKLERLSLEKRLQELVNKGVWKHAEPSAALLEKNYKILGDGTLTHKFSMHSRLYHRNFGTFIRHTTEKPETVRRLENYLPVMIQHLRDPARDEFVLTDLGFGNGNFTHSLAAKVLPHVDDSSTLHINGVEVLPKFVDQTKRDFRNYFLSGDINEDYRLGNFYRDEIPEDFQHRSQLIVLSHALYKCSDIVGLNRKIAALAHPKGALGIYIHEKPSAIDSFIKDFSHILLLRTKEDASAKIKESLKFDSSLVYTSEVFNHEVTFPSLTQREWESLKEGVEYFDFENSYVEQSPSWQEFKQMTEFLFQEPLEGIPRLERIALLDAFRVLLEKNQNKLVMQNEIIFVGFNGAGSLITALKDQQPS